MNTQNCGAGSASPDKLAPEILALVRALARQLAREDNEAALAAQADNPTQASSGSAS